MEWTVADEPVALMQPTAVPVMPGERALRGGSRYEVKVDGWRARAVIRPGGRAELRSRRGTSLDGRFPELAIALAGLPLGMVLDGEIVAAHPGGSLDFLALQRSRQARAAAGLTDLYIAFDVLAGPGGADLRQWPLRERVAVLDQVLDPHVGSRVQKIASTTDHAVALEWMAALPPGFEGCVVKAKASRYDPRDHRAWVKVRATRTVDLLVLGVTGTAARPQQVVVLHEGRHRLTTPRLQPPEARDVASVLRGRLAEEPYRDTALDGTTVRPLIDGGDGLLAEVRVTEGRHQALRFMRLRPDLL
ncbi:hypothetical protein ACFVVJ_29145 [Streptomyces albidoflavus]